MSFIRCTECSDEKDIVVEKPTKNIIDGIVHRRTQHLSPEEVIEEVFNIGWFIDETGTICPTCNEVKNGANTREVIRQVV
ncbi:hypothetical protein KAR91_21940 [Candidatus Pacearchaeota archaeon]|nr:hypothetical protein [Candidatus Pacearchaeota archaeon]